MSISSIDDEVSVQNLVCFEEVPKPSQYKIFEVFHREIEKVENFFTLCKSHKSKIKKAKPEANTKGNVFSIITGLALVGIGAVIGMACPPAGMVISGAGVSMIANALGNEINDAAKDPDPIKNNSSPNQIEYGGEISVGVTV